MDQRQNRGHPRMTRIYRYILTHNTGMAPCPENGMITLGTCKPVIRRVARAGDWVLGFPRETQELVFDAQSRCLPAPVKISNR